MREVLIIITNKAGTLVPEVVELQREFPDQKVEVLDFTHVEPDYEAALEKIFQADSVQVW